MNKPRTCSLVYLPAGDRRMLVVVSNCASLRPTTRRRARIILLADRNRYPQTTDIDVSVELGVSTVTVAAIRKRYTTAGMLDALTSREDEAALIKHLAPKVLSVQGNITPQVWVSNI